jgi:hypothetical protein
MRIVGILAGLGCSVIYLGCGTSESDEPPSPEEDEREVAARSDSGDDNLTLSKSHPEEINYGEGCQKYVYNGDNPKAFTRFQRSTCYDVAESAAAGSAAVTTRVVTVYYQRHAISTWNEASVVTHKVTAPPQLTDAHLSQAGIQQAIDVQKLVEKGLFDGDQKDREILSKGSHNNEKVVFATSNLRRSTLTFLISFKHLLKRKIKIHILSALQESTGNMDSSPLSGPGEIPKLSFASGSSSQGASPTCPFKKKDMQDMMVTRCNQGNEQMSPSNGSTLLKEPKKKDPALLTQNLCTWMWNVASFGENFMDISGSPTTPSNDHTNFVMTGHGQYIKALFSQYMANPAVPPARPPTQDEQNLRDRDYRLKNSSIIRFEVRITKNVNPATPISCKLELGSTKVLIGEIAQLGRTRRALNIPGRVWDARPWRAPQP